MKPNPSLTEDFLSRVLVATCAWSTCIGARLSEVNRTAGFVILIKKIQNRYKPVHMPPADPIAGIYVADRLLIY